jgi:hypothetical protein
MSSTANIKITGHVLARYSDNGEVVLDKYNAVHPANLALALARGLSNSTDHQVYRLKLGNGGSAIDMMNLITYLPPNVTGNGATLYNETYSEVVDEEDIGNVGSGNSVSYQVNPDVDETALVLVTATIAAGEPAGQDLTDSPANPDPEAQFAFDELGLFTSDDRLLSHIIFSPILKTANRELVITYTLTIAVS